MTETYLSDNPDFPAKLVIGTLFSIAFLGYLNETLLNVALSTLMVEFNVSKNTIQWLTTGFLLIMGAFAPITASILQWLNTRTMALLTLSIFLAGSLICAFASNFAVLFSGRMIQAISAACAVPMLMNAILAIYPPHKRGRAMSLVAVIFTVAPAIGPTLSGVILDYLGWQYLFLMTTPFVIIAMLVILTTVKVNLTQLTRPSIDFLSSILSVLGFGGLVFACSQFSNVALDYFLAILVFSISMIAWFVKRQFTLETPLLNLRTFGVAQFRYSMLILFIAYFLFLGLELLLPMYTQQVLLLSGTLTGLILMPASMVQAVFAPIFGIWLDKKGGRTIAILGMFIMLMAVGVLWWCLSLSLAPMVLSVIFACFAISIASAMTIETHSLNHLPKALNPHGTAIISTIMPIAGALGGAFFIGITQVGETLSNQSNAQLAMLSGVKLAVMIGLILAFIAFVCSLKIRTEYQE